MSASARACAHPNLYAASISKFGCLRTGWRAMLSFWQGPNPSPLLLLHLSCPAALYTASLWRCNHCPAMPTTLHIAGCIKRLLCMSGLGYYCLHSLLKSVTLLGADRSVCKGARCCAALADLTSHMLRALVPVCAASNRVGHCVVFQASVVGSWTANPAGTDPGAVLHCHLPVQISAQQC